MRGGEVASQRQRLDRDFPGAVGACGPLAFPGLGSCPDCAEVT